MEALINKNYHHFWLISLMIILSFISMAFYYAVVDPELALAKSLVFINIAIVAISVLNDITTKKFDLFNVKIIFLVYFSLQFIIWPIMILWVGLTRRPIEIDGYYTLSLFYSVLGLLFFLIGNSLSSKVTLTKSEYSPSDSWSVTLIWALVFCCIIFGYLAFLKLMQFTGGISNYISLSGYYRSGGFKGLGSLVYLSTTILALPILFYTTTYFRHPHRVSAFNLFVLGCLVFICLFPAAVIGYRTAILFPLMQLLLIYNYTQKKLSGSFLVFSSIIVLFFMMGLGYWRQQISIPDANMLTIFGLELIETASRFNASEVVAITIKKLEETGNFAFGIPSLLSFFTIIIPRAIYPDKIESMSVRFSQEIMADWFPSGIDPSGVAPSIIGEMYWHFSIFGVTIGLAIFGFICGRIYKFAMLHIRNRSILVLYSVFYSYVFFAAEAPTVATNGFIPLILVITIFIACLNTGKLFSK